MVLINFFANLIITLSVTIFYIYIYGDESKVVHRWKFTQHYSLKLGLIGIIAGSLFNALTMPSLIITETLLNVGLALVFAWSAVFHRKIFLNERHKNTRKD